MTVSEFKSLGLRKTPYKGLSFYDLTFDVKPIVNATFALGFTEKAVLRGPLSFDRHSGSYLYPNEVVISLWSTTSPKIENRAKSNTKFRLEIPVPLPIFEKMLRVALNRIWNLSHKINNQRSEKRKVADFL